ncbi:MAG: type II toxin-antitoxin system RelE/ParE family toxin [Actinobacteria bacterium]|nr:type II toxin-antitoxin system RelE/ParE family toxin [Actinomycetota bacterium]
MIKSFADSETRKVFNRRFSKDREGQHSIRINDQWRVCFVWDGGDAYNVEITDYH